MSQSDNFWDKTAEKYAKRAVPNEEIFQRKLLETQSFFTPDMRVLEFGCGTGSAAIHHAPVVRQYDAIDFSDNMIELCRSKAQMESVRNVTFTRATLHEFNAKDSSLDAVLGLNVIHLMPNRHDVIAEVARILKPGGIFVSSTGCLGGSPFRFIKWLVPIAKPFGLMPDVFIFKENELAEDIEAAGFSIETQWHHGPKGISVFIVARKL